MALSEKIQEARRQGYSDSEIYEFLKPKAIAEGHAETAVKDYLSGKGLNTGVVKEQERKPTGLTHRPFAGLRSLLRKPTTTEKKEQIGKVMERSRWDIEGLKQWTRDYWDTVKAISKDPNVKQATTKGRIKEFQKLETRLSEEKRNPIDALEKIGWAGLAVNMGVTAGQMLEPAFVSAVAKIRPDLAKQVAVTEPTKVLAKSIAPKAQQEALTEIKAIMPRIRRISAHITATKSAGGKVEPRVYAELEQLNSRISGLQRVAYPPTQALPSTAPALTGGAPPQTSVQRVMVALKRVKPLRRAQETIYTKERGAKLAKGLVAEEKVIGEAGYEKGFYAKLGAMKGEMPKVQFESIRKDVSEQDIENLFRVVKESRNITEFEKITVAKGLGKLFGEYGGRVPTDGEISLLNRVFPQEFTKALLEARPMLSKMKEAGYQLANIPRSIKASFDLSAPFRQGIFFIGRPKQFARAFAGMFKQFGSDKAFKIAQEEIFNRPTHDLMVKGRLPLTELGKDLTKREEVLMSQWAEKIPLGIGRVVRASGRAYVGFLNRLRADVFDSLIMKAEKLGLNPKTNMDLTTEIAKFVGLGTGRGTLGGLERSAVALNTGFFSPRLTASRLQLLNPYYYIKADPFVRKEALKSLFSMVGVGMTTLGLAKLGGVEVGTDWRSADFLKIKIGNTRIDPWGGFQQYIVIGARLITGQAVSSTTGRVTTFGEGYKPLTRLDIIQRGIEFKLSPIFTFAKNLMKGQTVAGKPVTISTEAKNMFIPMAIEDVYDIMVDDPNLIPVSLLGIFGVGLQTYKGRGAPFSFKGAPRTGGKLRLGGKGTATGKLKLGG